ncbi:phage holin family protein [Rhodococcus rhodnii]|uniref:Integral membrane protein n=2 Tax=Rhodococcus rhodnii TaxID=38312 RepID=R7WPC9_9NOCA|nr:phage holin family protein [Rhodococcus rhodnii]EOM77177.1 hypothetical protein Rrhod_1425 [Rhodococcus rhodnii LMG 5362]TXG91955.1 phage holin family protein [Rhodococcus rhodnii]
MTFILRWVFNALAIWVAVSFVSGVAIANPDGRNQTALLTLAFIALVFTVVNAFVKPVVKLLSLPLLILTLGLFTLVINALMLMLTAWISSYTDYGLTVDGFWTAMWAALIISIVNWALGALSGGRVG